MPHTRTACRKIELSVPADYVLDSWLCSAPPEEVALLLDLASRLPRVVGRERSEIDARLSDARDDGTRLALREVLDEATRRADAQLQERLRALEEQREAACRERSEAVRATADSEQRATQQQLHAQL